jgi:hypothetical protein
VFVAVEEDRRARTHGLLVDCGVLVQGPQASVRRGAGDIEAVAAVGGDVGVTDGAELRECVVADELGLVAADVVVGGGEVARVPRRGSRW